VKKASARKTPPLHEVTAYDGFLESKRQAESDGGFAPVWTPDFLFGFQRTLVEWALRKGRAAIFADCGMGKTPMQLVWAENVVRKTGDRVLIVAPLAVIGQAQREAIKFGLELTRSIDGRPWPGVTITNYERLHLFSPSDFAGIACDESSILKSFEGATRAAITEFMRQVRYRLLCTATAAPNDYYELGTSSEALGYLGFMDMLARFFKNNRNNTAMKPIGHLGGMPVWRFRGHAERPFWRWVCSWARSVRKPSDLGFDDGAFVLPDLVEREHVIRAQKAREGFLFSVPAVGMQEEREERRRTIKERCEMAAELSAAHAISMVWCHLNDEGELLEQLVPRSMQIKGSDSEEKREAIIEWFCGRRCVCDDPMFRDKLATWGKESLATGSATIARIASSDSPSRTPTGRRTEKSAATTTRSTTSTTSRSIDEAMLSKENTTLPGAENIGTTKSSEPRPSPNPRRGGRRIRQNGPTGQFDGMEAVLPTPKPSSDKAEDAPSVDVSQPGHVASTSTTATAEVNTEDCSARIATLASGSSEMIQAFLSERQCICGHSSGERRLISKPVMLGWGLNLQHCAHMVTFSGHSFEQYYQSVRRFWRFGQKERVVVDHVISNGEQRVLHNLRRKSEQADKMFAQIVEHMREEVAVVRDRSFDVTMRAPSWA
jgi:hypothetical protein